MIFLHSIGPSVNLHWPAIEDKYWVPLNHVLQLLPIPTVNTSGRNYTFLKSELKIHRKNSLKIFEHENIVLCAYQWKFVVQLQTVC